jgi:hypothetical protein
MVGIAMSDSARMIIEVVAGIVPGKNPEPEFTHRWAVTSDEWHLSTDEVRWQLLHDRNQLALTYAAELMERPDRLNWVRVDWIWL